MNKNSLKDEALQPQRRLFFSTSYGYKLRMLGRGIFHTVLHVRGLRLSRVNKLILRKTNRCWYCQFILYKIMKLGTIQPRIHAGEKYTVLEEDGI